MLGNSGKTKAMACGKNTTQRPYTEECTLDITVDGTPIEQVSNFTYLGSVISSDGTTDREFSSRIGKASGAFNQLGSIWNNRNITFSTKLRIYKAAIVTILLYGSEAWSTTQLQMKRFECAGSYALGGFIESEMKMFLSELITLVTWRP